jgi:plasmid stabilization system protein ParE
LREIIISAQTQKKIRALLGYIEVKWSERIRIAFAKKLLETLQIVRNNREGFPKSEINKKQHKCVLSKQTTIYYKFNSKQIRILSIFDTRQNPLKIKKIQ